MSTWEGTTRWKIFCSKKIKYKHIRDTFIVFQWFLLRWACGWQMKWSMYLTYLWDLLIMDSTLDHAAHWGDKVTQVQAKTFYKGLIKWETNFCICMYTNFLSYHGKIRLCEFQNLLKLLFQYFRQKLTPRRSREPRKRIWPPAEQLPSIFVFRASEWVLLHVKGNMIQKDRINKVTLPWSWNFLWRFACPRWKCMNWHGILLWWKHVPWQSSPFIGLWFLLPELEPVYPTFSLTKKNYVLYFTHWTIHLVL